MKSKVCTYCFKEFHKKANENESYWASKKYCCNKCYGLSKVGVRPSEETLNKIIKNLEAHRNSQKRLNAIIRGDDHYNWKGGLINKCCEQCGSGFMVKAYRKISARFCSKKCKTDNSNKGKTNEHEKIRKSLEYKEWRKMVFERDKYTCQQCGIKSGLGHGVFLHADHIKPFALYPALRLVLDNGKTLCQECHKKTETYGRKKIYRENTSLIIT